MKRRTTGLSLPSNSTSARLVHLFFECPFTRFIWCEVAGWRNCSGLGSALRRDATSFGSCYDLAIGNSPVGHCKGASSLFILVCWSIWRESHFRIFHDKDTSARQIVYFINNEAQEWAFARAKALRKLLWEPP